MFFIPIWVTNVLFLAAAVLAGVQHSQMNRENPVLNIQFGVMSFAIVMMVLVTLYNYENPWVALAFFLMAIGSLLLTIRQQRMMPPRKRFE